MKNNNSENIDEYELKFIVSRFEPTNHYKILFNRKKNF